MAIVRANDPNSFAIPRPATRSGAWDALQCHPPTGKTNRYLMILKTSVLSVLLAMAFSVHATAGQAVTLTCAMGKYPPGSRSYELEKLVPPNSTQVISGDRSQLKETNSVGIVEETETRIKLRYYGTLKGIGDTEVIYTLVKPNGLVIVKTRGLRTIVWDTMYPERTGRFEITGQCTIK